MRKLLGRNDIEDALKRLDTLTMEEARMAITKNLNVTYSVDNKASLLIESGQEALNATKKVDDKVSIFINGGEYAVFFWPSNTFLIIDTARRTRNKYSHSAVGQRRIL